MRRMQHLVVLCFFFFSTLSYAVPSQIILLRHADKLSQKETGPALSAKGYARSIKFAFYFLEQYGEPDFVIAGKPKNEDSSIRELQTIGPLVNILAERHPEAGFNILHPYTHDEQEKLANYLLTNHKFDNKRVLICWRHTKIVELAKSLGVTDHLEKWPDDDYDSVYVIEYSPDGHLTRSTLLHNQYPLFSEVSWRSLLDKVSTL